MEDITEDIKINKREEAIKKAKEDGTQSRVEW